MQSTPYDRGPLDQVDELDRTDEVEVDDATDSRAEIEWKKVEIEQTRAEMTDTLSAIKDRLQPQVLMDQAKEKVHDVTTEAVHRAKDATFGRAQDAVGNAWYSAREAGGSVVDTVKENPIPIALIGVGVAWLLTDALRSRRTPQYSTDYYAAYDQDYDVETGYSRRRYSGEYETDGYTGESRGVRQRVGERVGDMKDTVRDAAGNVRERAGEAVETIRDKAGNIVGGVRERVGDMTGRVRERTEEMGNRAAVRASLAKMETREMARSAQDCMHDTMQNNPMALGLVALGIGAAIGFLLPETRREHEMMGEAKERVMDQAKQAAGEVKEKVQNVAQRVQGVATEAIDQAKQSAKDALNEAKTVATEEAQNQGLTGQAASTPGTSTNWPSGV